MHTPKSRLNVRVRPALQMLASVAFLWAAAQVQGADVPLKFNTYYTCGAQRIVIRSCVDQSNSDYKVAPAAPAAPATPTTPAAPATPTTPPPRMSGP